MADETKPVPNPDDLRQKVQTWLMGEGWKLSEKQHPQAAWLIEADDGANRRIIVGLAHKPGDQVRIQAGVTVAPNHKAQFAALPEGLRSEVLWDLRFRLLGMNVEFEGVGEPLERIGINQRIYADGLTKDAFLQRVSLVKNALIAVIWSIVRNLEGVQAPTSQADTTVN